MDSKLLTRPSRRRSGRILTNIIWLAAIFLFVVPNYLTGVARASAGDLVAGFGSGGKVTTDFYNNNYDSVFAVATYPDGKILLAGTSRSTTEDFVYDIALARYNPDGSLDQTFGNGGLVKTDFNEMESARAVAIQPDGKIVVAGTISRFDGSTDFAVLRYHEDGTLDSSFGQGGLVSTDFYNTVDSAADLAITPNGEIVVAGTVWWVTDFVDSDFAVVRYDSDGNLDMTFGDHGKVTVHSEIDEDLAAMVLTPKGQIVLAGTRTSVPGEGYNVDFVLFRFNRDGSLDASFGIDGRVITDFSAVDTLSDVALTSDGDIIAVGTAQPTPGHLDFVVARYNRNGRLDPSFGTAGSVITDFSMRDDFAFAVAVRSNGKIVVAGTSGWVTGRGQNDFALARYERDGTLDQSFGSGGLLTTDFAGDTDEAKAVAILPSGRIVVAGNRWDWTNQSFYPSVDFALVEYEWR
ncbi:MAG TPA: delta-60 repeat domain-containing protein [Pyrinomonadaceae bacterium]|nr:delta-60 repeat domain-containing protein [Pyrinomonadaceae bacterium]